MSAVDADRRPLDGGTAEGLTALGTVLTIWAHPDDETFLAGGLMARLIERGHRVACAVATPGEHGTADPVAWPPARLADRRRLEFAASMQLLGVDEYVVGPFEDGTLADVPLEQGRAWVAGHLAAVRPTTVVTFGPDGYTNHPDHRAVSRWVDAAVLDAVGPPRQVLHAVLSAEHHDEFAADYERWGVFIGDERPVPVAVDELALRLLLDGEDLDRKMAALEALASQTRGAIEAIGRDRFLDDIREESFVRAPVCDVRRLR